MRYYWVKWNKDDPEWDIGGYLLYDWFCMGNEEFQKKPEIIGSEVVKPDD